MDEYSIIKELVKRHNNGEIDLNDADAEKLAIKAYQYQIPFEVESKPIKKGLFDLVDTAPFGMVPNEWRPKSAGEDLYGESGWDRFAGGTGSLLGLGSAVGLGIKGARGIYGSFQGGRAADALSKVKEMEAITRAKNYASRMYNQGRNYPEFPEFLNFRYP